MSKKCAKCSHKVISGPDYHETTHNPDIPYDEVLQYRCCRCHYCWNEPCDDAPSKQEPRKLPGRLPFARLLSR